MNIPPQQNPRRPGWLGAATMWARLRPDLTLEAALAALDEAVRSEEIERETYRRPYRRRLSGDRLSGDRVPGDRVPGDRVSAGRSGR